MKANDRKPHIETQPVRWPPRHNQTVGDLVNFTGATSIRFVMRALIDGAPTGAVKVNSAAVADMVGTTAADGFRLRYPWMAADTNLPGLYAGEFTAVMPDGEPVTFPTASYYEIAIVADLDGT